MTAVDIEPEAGQVLSARYVLEAQIGQGAMGWVWRAHDVELSRKVAVKILLPSLAEQTDVRERFAREARAIAALDHPNVVPVHDVGREGRLCYFVMKLLAGTPLHLRLENGPLPLDEAVAVTIHILDGLEHLHARGLVHRDIKPGNVIVSPEGRATIVDFGILRPQSHEPRMTAEGLFVGTPEYVAPEVIRAMPGEPRSDLYSLGVTLFELLTGDVPFHGETPIELVTRHLRDPAPLPSSVRAGIPRELDEVVRRALAKHPQDRWESAAEMRRALEAARPALRRPIARDSRQAPTVTLDALPMNRRGRVALLGLAVVALASIGLFARSLARPMPEAAPRAEHQRPVRSMPAVVASPAAPPIAPSPATPSEPPRVTPPPHDIPAVPARPTEPARHVPRVASATTMTDPTPLPTKDPAPTGGSTLDRARAALRAGSASQAVALFQQASRESPGSAAPFRGLGDAYVAIGNRTAAVAAYRRYLLSSPQARDRADVEARLARLGAPGH